MKNLRSVAIAIIVLGLVSLAIGVIMKFAGAPTVAGFSPRGFGFGAGLCFLLSVDLLLLDHKS